ncbi:MAG: zf-HC2 domain-containing protein [Burkholderiales bacterium]
MNCDEVGVLLSPDVDGEIDGLRSHAISKHLVGCASCSSRQQAMQSLRQQLRDELPRHAAPLAFRERVRQAIDASPPNRPHIVRPASSWGWFGGGALSGAFGVGLLWIASAGLLPMQDAQDLATQIVGVHTRATLGNHLIEVASSDRHKVKPWLSARLDYAIPVTDWAGAGYPLVGARVDRLDGKLVATLVYRYRDHVIDVFVRPSPRSVAGSDASPVLRTVRGFNVAVAQGAEMQWLATSDLNGIELEAFVRGLARGDVKPPG